MFKRCFFSLSIILLIGALSQCRKSGEQVIYLIPNHFIGNIVIVYDCFSGSPMEYIGGSRVYRIPSNGILRTKFKPNYGLRESDKYYYVDEKGRVLKSIPYFDTNKEIPAYFLPEDIICFHETPFTDSKTPRGHYSIISISSIAKSDSVFENQKTVIIKL